MMISKTTSITRLLSYKPPFDWEAILSAFRSHRLLHLETVDDLAYERVVKTALGIGWFRIDHDLERTCVRLSVWNGSDEDAETIARSARRMFDLDADPGTIGQVMSGDPYLSSVWARHPGLRVFRSWSGFESILTTVLGQLVFSQLRPHADG